METNNINIYKYPQKQKDSMLITFSGLDGSGKTTHINFLLQHLKQHNVPYKLIHFHQWSIFGKLSTWSKKHIPQTKKHIDAIEFSEKKSFKKFCIGVFKKIAIVVDVLRFYIFLQFYKQTIICDRYFFDQCAQALSQNLCSVEFACFITKIVPSPHCSFFLYIEPEIAFNRTEQYPLKYYEKKWISYLTVFAPPFHNKKYILLHSKNPIHENKIKIFKEVFHADTNPIL